MKQRKINLNDKFIGVIGIDNNNNPFYKSNLPAYDTLLKSLITPLKIDFSAKENDVSISINQIILLTDENWLFYLQFTLPANIYAEQIEVN